MWVPTRLTRTIQHQETETGDGKIPTENSDDEPEDPDAPATAPLPDAAEGRG